MTYKQARQAYPGVFRSHAGTTTPADYGSYQVWIAHVTEALLRSPGTDPMIHLIARDAVMAHIRAERRLPVADMRPFTTLFPEYGS